MARKAESYGDNFIFDKEYKSAAGEKEHEKKDVFAEFQETPHLRTPVITLIISVS